MQESIKDKFLNLLESFLGSGKKDVSAIGIDIGSSSIKLVELNLKNNKIYLSTYGSISLGFYANKALGECVSLPPEKIVEALNELLKDCGVKSKNSAFSIPSTSSFFKQIYIPDTITKEEMQTVVETESRRVIPIPFNDVKIDSIEIPKEIRDKSAIQEGKKELLLVALPKETLATAQKISEAALLESKFYEIESFSVLRSIYAHERSPIVMVDMGALKTKVYIVHEGVLSFVSGIDFGGANLTQFLTANSSFSFKDAQYLKHSLNIKGNKEEEILLRKEIESNIINPLSSLINNYEKISSSAVSRIVLCGGGAEMDYIDVLFQDKLNLPTTVSSPFNRVILPLDASQTIREIAPEFSVATGLALRLLTSA